MKKARDVAAEKETLRLQLEKLQNRKNVLEIEATRRRKSALKTISKVAADLLRQDHGVQEEFVQAQEVEVNFRDDAIFVDGKMNFAESSNVYLKNAVFLAIFLAAGIDAHFYHPKFLLMDNIEDKGMQPARSHLFQALIVRLATELKIDFQIIFTTSMMNAKLELEEYVVGPYYSKENRTLQFNGPPPKNHSPPTTV